MSFALVSLFSPDAALFYIRGRSGITPPQNLDPARLTITAPGSPAVSPDKLACVARTFLSALRGQECPRHTKFFLRLAASRCATAGCDLSPLPMPSAASWSEHESTCPTRRVTHP